jgi:hypothetical protein
MEARIARPRACGGCRIGRRTAESRSPRPRFMAEMGHQQKHSGRAFLVRFFQSESRPTGAPPLGRASRGKSAAGGSAHAAVLSAWATIRCASALAWGAAGFARRPFRGGVKHNFHKK